MRSTGWPRPSSTPCPRRIGSRRRAAVSSPIRASRQRGGRWPPVMGILPLTADLHHNPGSAEARARLDQPVGLDFRRARGDHRGRQAGRGGAPGPRARARARCWSGSGPPGSTARTCCSWRAAIRRPRARRRTSRASSSPARWWPSGPGAERFAEGDRVMAVVGGGGQAELAVVHERAAMPVPDGLDWPQAGGLPEVFTTAHDALFTQAGLRPGERLLVHGGGRRRGHRGVQLGRAAGARGGGHGPARGAARRRRAARAPPRSTPRASRSAGPFDVVLELVGAPNLPGNLQGARHRRPDRRDRRGRRRQGGAQPAGADGQARAHPRLDPARAPARGEGDRACAWWSARCCRCSSQGALKVPVAATFPLDEAEQAYERFTAGGKLGKIVLLA